jgi:hypothetical protein
MNEAINEIIDRELEKAMGFLGSVVKDTKIMGRMRYGEVVSWVDKDTELQARASEARKDARNSLGKSVSDYFWNGSEDHPINGWQRAGRIGGAAVLGSAGIAAGKWGMKEVGGSTAGQDAVVVGAAALPFLL